MKDLVFNIIFLLCEIYLLFELGSDGGFLKLLLILLIARNIWQIYSLLNKKSKKK